MRKHIPTYKTICTRVAGIMQCLFLLSPFMSNARQAVDTPALYVAPNAVMYVNGNVQMAVFSNVINSGNFGTFKGATVNMLGSIWRNTASGALPDELGINNASSFSGVGGIFRFSNNSDQQFLTAGYSVSAKAGSSFPNLSIANPRGLYLYQSDALIRGSLVFENGLFVLNDHNLMVGSKDPGIITGYTETRFVATGNGAKGGYLYRAKLAGSSGSVVFPVGGQTGSYAPVSVMFNTSAPQDLHVRVFDNIYSNAFIGTTGSPASVQQTWNIGHENNTPVPSILAVQHTAQREGAAFTAHRGNSYISMYDFTARTWDTLGPSGISTPGSLTTATPQPGSYVNTRSFNLIGQNMYLTKTADTGTDSVTISKAALSPVRQPDGSFLVTYMFLIRNTARYLVSSVQVFDSLDKVFHPSATFTVLSVSASGNLVANKGYDGITATGLLLPASTLAPRKTDTVMLVVNVVSTKQNAYYYNIASLQGTMNGNNGRQYVIDNRSVDGMVPPAPTTPPLATPVILTAAKYIMPQGFSPNGDGVNDRLVIGNLGNNQASLWIFNKQGILIYRNANYRNEWDGFSNQGGPLSAQRVEDGTYFYKAVITEAGTGKQETYYGFLSLWK